jgi:hypothetical protein
MPTTWINATLQHGGKTYQSPYQEIHAISDVINYEADTKIVHHTEEIGQMIYITNTTDKPFVDAIFTQYIETYFEYVEGSFEVDGQKQTPIVTGAQIKYNVNLDVGKKMNIRYKIKAQKI